MNKLDLAAKVAEKAKLCSKKEAEIAVDALFEVIAKELKAGEPVKISGFGSFEVKLRKARTGVIPGTSKPIKIPATKVVGFKPAKSLKESIK
jgi:DNA-binding protein HU-beta